MAYPATNIPNRSAGEFIDDPDWDELVDALNFLANPPACRVQRTTNQTITTGTDTKIQFNAADSYDTAAMHDTATNNTRITVPRAGLYAVSAVTQWTTGGTATVTSFWVNGSDSGGAAARHDEAATTFHQITTDTLKLNANDYIELNVFHLAGADRIVNLAKMAARWVGNG